MDKLSSLAQKDGRVSTGQTVTNYTVQAPAYSQPQVPNKTPLHSRTQPDR